MTQIDMQHQKYLTSTKYETTTTPPGRYESPRIGKYFLLRLASAICALILTDILLFPPNPPPDAMYLIAIKHRTYQIDIEYETADTPAGRYGPHRVGKYCFL